MADDELKGLSKNDLVREVRRLRTLLGDTLKQGGELEIASGINEEGKPFVHVRWDDKGQQMTPAQAREFSNWIADAGLAAEHDSAVFKMLTERLELPADKAAVFVSELRIDRGGADVESFSATAGGRQDHG